MPPSWARPIAIPRAGTSAASWRISPAVTSGRSPARYSTASGAGRSRPSACTSPAFQGRPASSTRPIPSSAAIVGARGSELASATGPTPAASAAPATCSSIDTISARRSASPIPGRSRCLASARCLSGIRIGIVIDRRLDSGGAHPRLQGIGRAVRAEAAARVRARGRAPRPRQRRRLRPLPAVPPHRRPRPGGAALAGCAGGQKRADPDRHSASRRRPCASTPRWSPSRSRRWHAWPRTESGWAWAPANR